MLRASVVVFPGSNCDRDIKVALEARHRLAGRHGLARRCRVPASDLIVLPGGFSYGDYLRCGAMAAHSPIMRDVIAKARRGTPRARHLQRLPGAVRGGPAARRADAQRLAEVRLPRRRAARSTTTRRSSPRLPQGPGHPDADRARARATTSPTRRRSTASRARAASYSATRRTATSTQRPIPTAPSATSPASATRRGRVLGLMPHPERAVRARARRRRRPAHDRERAVERARGRLGSRILIGTKKACRTCWPGTLSVS